MKTLTTLLLMLATLGAAPLGAVERPVSLTTTAHEVVEGTFVGASATGVTVKVAGQRLEIAWEQVATLSFVGPVAGAPAAGAPSSAGLVGSPSTPSSPRPATSSGRCQATTQKGTQCSRKAQAGSSYCWQHQR